MRNNFRYRLAGFLLVAFFLVATRPAFSEEEGVSLIFGVYQSDKASTMYRTFLPVIEALQKSMEKSLGHPVDIEIKILKEYQEGINALVEGTVDFVRFGPASYILAHEKNKNIRLLAMESKEGEKRFKGVIIVQKESDIETLEDLRGKTFAFGNKNSTIGRFLAQEVLVTAEIYSDDLAGFSYLGRHDKVINAVELGDYDAGSVKNKTYQKALPQGKIRALATFENVTKPWIARAGMDGELFNSLRDSLLKLKDEEALFLLKVSGFLATDDREYDFVRQGMLKARKFQR